MLSILRKRRKKTGSHFVLKGKISSVLKAFVFLLFQNMLLGGVSLLY